MKYFLYVCKIIVILMITITQTVFAPTYHSDRHFVLYDNTFEDRHALNNGVYCALDYTGDLLDDWGRFVLGQGGGMSKDSKDKSSRLLPPHPHTDGNYYHTVHDITWGTFRLLSKKYGYPNKSSDFYNMSDHTRRIIIQHHIDQANITSSDVVNSFLAYVLWGSGEVSGVLRHFNNIDDYIAYNGEYATLSACIDIRHKELKKARQWGVYGRGWSSGLAHFHRVFKHYCKT